MKLKVIESRPWHWYLRWSMLAAAVVGLSVWVGWNQGVGDHHRLVLENTELTRHQAKLTLGLERAERVNTRLTKEQQIAQVSVRQAGEDIGVIQEKNKQLEKELTFYRSIMAPELDRSGLTIDSLQLTHLGERRFEFELVLIQAKKQDWYLKGRFSLRLEGRKDGKKVIFSGADVITTKGWKPEFSFRYFQKITGTLLVPKGVRPAALVVSAHTRDGRQQAKHRFQWQFEENEHARQQEEHQQKSG